MDNFERVSALVVEAEKKLADIFADIDKVSFENTKRIMNSFKEHRVSETMFAASSGYGYDDHGREALDAIWADVMGAEAAFVRHSIVNGTQALTIGLFGLLRPNDIMFSIAGKPYDTLDEVIGNTGKAGDGSLRDFGVEYMQSDLLADGSFDFDRIEAVLKEHKDRIKVVFIQRSKGYLNRKTLSVREIGEAVSFVKAIHPECYVVIDNCYGEFTEVSEPCAVEMAEGARRLSGADLAVSATGYAEGGEGVPEGMAGVVFVALAHKDGTEVRRLTLSGGRSHVRTMAVKSILSMILNHCRTEGDLI